MTGGKRKRMSGVTGKTWEKEEEEAAAAKAREDQKQPCKNQEGRARGGEKCPEGP